MLEIRQTAIRTYLRCPLQYYYRYVKDLTLPPGIAAVAGTSVHKAAERFWTRKRDDEFPDYDEGYSEAAGLFEEKAREAPDDEDEKKRYRHILPDLVNGAYQSVVQTPELPMLIEHPVAITVEGVRLTGTIDLITDDAVCWDHKTGKRYTAADADRSLQLSIYGLMAEAAGVTTEAGGLVWIRENEFVRLPTRLDAVKRERTLMLLVHAIEGIKRGDFPPCNLDTGNAWWCSPKWCGYHQAGRFGGPCKFGGNA